MMSAGVATTRGGRRELEVTLRNTGKTLAFFMRLQLMKSHDEEVLPVLWQDNYVSLMPGERRVLTVTWNPKDAGGTAPYVVLSGSNVRRQVVVTR
jgi:exo-1,4-beta-D-glucosaminidase